jgi:hypothetical protein
MALNAELSASFDNVGLERVQEKAGEINTIDKTNSVVFSPQANYTDRATATCRQS